MGVQKVWHATEKGNGKSIAQYGWRVDWDGVNIFGRGIYFWEQEADAYRYAKYRFGTSYDIVSERIPVHQHNSQVYNDSRRLSSTIDQIAQGLLRRGIDVLVIPNHQIEERTMCDARGRAFLWLVDMHQSYREVMV